MSKLLSVSPIKSTRDPIRLLHFNKKNFPSAFRSSVKIQLNFIEQQLTMNVENWSLFLFFSISLLPEADSYNFLSSEVISWTHNYDFN